MDVAAARPHPKYGRGCSKAPLLKVLEITTGQGGKLSLIGHQAAPYLVTTSY